jgi:Icc-related predicted phosphoesterase
MGPDASGTLAPHFRRLADDADLLLLAGDLTKCGAAGEAGALGTELDSVGVPVVAVLGNHDLHSDEREKVELELTRAGVTVIEGEATVVDVHGTRVGIAGTKGFGGGFAGACGSDFGEPEMKAFIRHTQSLADRLEQALGDLDTDVKIALLHYAPIKETLLGERLEIYPFLGSYLFAEAVDRAGADLIVHGHAHGGSEKGITPGGIPVRNVALPVIKHPYNVYCLDGGCPEAAG